MHTHLKDLLTINRNINRKVNGRRRFYSVENEKNTVGNFAKSVITEHNLAMEDLSRLNKIVQNLIQTYSITYKIKELSDPVLFVKNNILWFKK